MTLIVACLCSTDSAFQWNVDVLKAICNDDKRVTLGRVSQLITVAEQLDDKLNLQCLQRTRDAIRKLAKIVTDQSDVCTISRVEQIRDFHNQFVVSEVGYQLPRTLRKFFVAFGFRASERCRKKMLESLVLEAPYILEDDDRMSFARLTHDKSLMGKLVKRDSDDSSMVLPRDVLRTLWKGRVDDKEQVYIEIPNGSQLRSIQALCSARFKPIYEQSLLPLIILINIGLDYKSKDTKATLALPQARGLVPWYRILYLCESLSLVEIVVNSSPINRVHVLSRSEVDAYRRSGSLGRGNNQFFKRINYKPGWRAEAMEDLVLDEHDSRLVRHVNKFELVNEASRILSKLNQAHPGKRVGGIRRLSGLDSFRWKHKSSIEKMDTDELITIIEGFINKRLELEASGTSADSLLKILVSIF